MVPVVPSAMKYSLLHFLPGSAPPRGGYAVAHPPTQVQPAGDRVAACTPCFLRRHHTKAVLPYSPHPATRMEQKAMMFLSRAREARVPRPSGVTTIKQVKGNAWLRTVALQSEAGEEGRRALVRP